VSLTLWCKQTTPYGRLPCLSVAFCLWGKQPARPWPLLFNNGNRWSHCWKICTATMRTEVTVEHDCSEWHRVTLVQQWYNGFGNNGNRRLFHFTYEESNPHVHGHYCTTMVTVGPTVGKFATLGTEVIVEHDCSECHRVTVQQWYNSFGNNGNRAHGCKPLMRINDLESHC
jgi:hypothetical protein